MGEPQKRAVVISPISLDGKRIEPGATVEIAERDFVHLLRHRAIEPAVPPPAPDAGDDLASVVAALDPVPEAPAEPVVVSVYPGATATGRDAAPADDAAQARKRRR